MARPEATLLMGRRGPPAAWHASAPGARRWPADTGREAARRKPCGPFPIPRMTTPLAYVPRIRGGECVRGRRAAGRFVLPWGRGQGREGAGDSLTIILA